MRRFPLALLVLSASCSPDSTEESEGRLPGDPGAAARFRYEQRLSADGTMPVDALARAKHTRDAMVERQVSTELAGLDRDSWRWIGPGGVGGRIRSILIHPTTPEVMWVGSVAGGIWKTTDGGASWQHLDDFLTSLAVCCMAMHPARPDVLYAGTGEGFFNHDAVRGAGIFRSTDGGTTWTRLPGTVPSAAATQWHFVNRIAIHPTDPNVLLAATNRGIYRTTDGGISWRQRDPLRTVDVDFHPTDGTRAIAGQGRTTRNDAIVSFSTDGGVTWAAATGIPGNAERIEVAYAAANPTIVFASVASYDIPSKTYGTAGLFRSTNGGLDFTVRNSAVAFLHTQGWYYNALWVDPTDAAAQTVIVGGLDLWGSSDGGASLIQLSDWSRVPVPGDSAHADQHVIVSHPSYGAGNHTVYFGNDGGIYRADDILTLTPTAGWTNLNNNLGITQFYGAGINRSTGVILGGTQDNSNLRYAGDRTEWTTIQSPTGGFTGDGGVAVASSDSAGPGAFYAESQYLGLFRSTDGARTSTRITDGIAADELGSGNAPFVAPLALDPNDSDRLYAGSKSLWMTSDATAVAPTWSRVKAPALNPAGDPVFVSAVAVAEGDPDVVWVGHKDGQIYRTTNATIGLPAWTRRDTAAMPGRFVSDIAIDRRDHDRVFVTVMGFAADNVWRTDDGGTTWRAISGPLPQVPVSSIALHPCEHDWIYVGTDLGVFASEDGGTTWSAMTEGPANTVVDDLVWKNERTLLAITHGRGVFQGDVGPDHKPAPRITRRASVDSFGTEAVGGSSVSPSLSADGRFIAFASNASNLVANDTNRVGDIFVHDRVLGTTERVSIPDASLPQTQGSGGGAGFASISADGRFVAFDSQATNLVNFGVSGGFNVYVHDRQTGSTILVSHTHDRRPFRGGGTSPHISPNGRYVAFVSASPDLVPNDTNGLTDVFVRDLENGQTHLVSVSSSGQQTDHVVGPIYGSVSDGGIVAFTGTAKTLVPNKTNNRKEVFIHVLSSGLTIRASSLPPAEQTNGSTFDWPRISANGDVIVFDSLATNLVVDRGSGRGDVYAYDLINNETTRISVSSCGTSGNDTSRRPSMSADGRYVAFQSAASNLVPRDRNGTTDVFVHDRHTGHTARVSIAPFGRDPDAPSGGSHPFSCAVSGDGRFTAFQSRATNLVPNDTNGLFDIFFHELHPIVPATNTPRPNETFVIDIYAPDDPGRAYFAAVSTGTSPGIRLPRGDDRVLPLNPDGLFAISLGANNPLFEDFVGVLDAHGRATAKLHLPNIPQLAGITLWAGWFAVRPGAPNRIGTISPALRIEIVP